MKQRRRRSVKSAAEIVDLVEDSDDHNDDDNDPAFSIVPKEKGNSRIQSRLRRTAAAAAGAGTQATAHSEGCEYIDSDVDEPLPPKPAAAAAQGRKRMLGAAAAGAVGSGSQQPAAKRAKAAAAGRSSRSKASQAAGSKQTTLKGFGALFLSASQPPANGSQGPADSQPGTLQVVPAAAAAAAAAAGGCQPGAAEAEAAGPNSPAELWADKFEPSSLSDLVVHKKKVSEVQDWLNFYLEKRGVQHTRALLITGPPGCGKSATLKVVAASLRFDVMEWTPPVPTLWSDHQYLAGTGVRYTSKLDEFDMFVARCKFAALPLSCSAGAATQPNASQLQQGQQQPEQLSLPQLGPLQQQQQQQGSQGGLPSQQPQQQQHQRKQPRQKLIVVDDLPYVADAERRSRLAAALRDLATTARCPVVVVATSDEGGGGKGPATGGYSTYGAAGAAGMTSKGLHKDFLAVLDQVGAGTISFNPITANNISKALHAIADKEGFVLDPDLAAGITQAAGGDLRNAIQNLQLMLQGPAHTKPRHAGNNKRGGKASKAPKRPRKSSKDPEAAAAAEAAQSKVSGQVSRDQHLSVFHAIGKLLHYKREEPDSIQQQQAAGGGDQQQRGSQAAPAAADAAPAAAAADDDDDDVVLVGDDVSDGGTASQQLAALNRYSRRPLLINPEDIVQGSGLEALQVTSFLAENYLHFVAGDAMQQAAEAATYLSDAGYLACYRNTAATSVSFWDEADPNAGSLQAAAACAVASRGLLFSNTRPAPSRWLPLKGPSCFVPERAAASNLQRLSSALQALQDDWSHASQGAQGAVMRLAGQLLHSGRQERAAQVLPFLQVLSRHPSRMWLHVLLPRSWAYVWQGSISERLSPAMQGANAAAVREAVAAVAAGVPALGQHSSQVQNAPPAGQDSDSERDQDAEGLTDEIESD